MSRSPQGLAEVINHALDMRLADVRVSLPGKVTRYDSSKQMVDVQPLIKQAYYDETETRQVESMPVIPNVPLMFQGAGGFRMTFPVEVGDKVLIVFSSSSLDKWLESGGEVDPNDDRQFSLADAVAIPGLRDFAHPLESAPTDRMTIGKDDGAQVQITDSEVLLGGDGAVDAVIKGTSYHSAESTFLTALSTWASAVATALGTIPAFVDPGKAAFTTATGAFNTAVSSFNTAASNALSAIVKTE